MSRSNWCATATGSSRSQPSAAATRGIKLIGGGPGADPGTEIRKAARTQLTDSVRAGTLKVFLDRTFPLAQAADAHRALRSGHATGKIVLTV